MLQNPSRRTYQSLDYRPTTLSAKGPYAVFDNVTAIFAANPVITRTATYIYACAEWIEDAFQGKELLLGDLLAAAESHFGVAGQSHRRSRSGAVHAASISPGISTAAWRPSTAVLAHVLGRDDMLITSRNIYGGAHQLIHDWYAKPGNLAVAVETFDGYDAADFLACWRAAPQPNMPIACAAGRRAYVYLESPCNPHGYVLDVPAICRAAHARGLRVMLDATVGTPFLVEPLQRDDPAERPDFVIHSYTKDLSGTGSVIAGVVIGRNEDMFIPKGETAGGVSWDQTLFWNVYYVKGAFLNADAAFEVMQGHADARSADAGQVHQHADPGALSGRASRDFRCTRNVLADRPNSPLASKRCSWGCRPRCSRSIFKACRARRSSGSSTICRRRSTT